MDKPVRKATAEDLEVVEHIVHSAYSHYVARIGQKPGPMLDDYARLIREGHVHVIEQNGAIRGILVLIPRQDALLLDNIAVSPSAQGTGLGRQLLDFAEAQSRALGYRAIELYTNEAMTENIQLYTRIGYSETHRAKEKGLRRVYMSKRLD